VCVGKLAEPLLHLATTDSEETFDQGVIMSVKPFAAVKGATIHDMTCQGLH